MSHLIQERINSNDPAFLYLNLHSGEEIKFIVRHHWAGFLPTLLIVTAMGLFPLFALFAFNLGFSSGLSDYVPLITVLFSGYYIFLATFVFGSWINYYYDIIFITNERIINVAQEGLLARTTSELSMKQIQNVSAEMTGFLQSLFTFGTLVIETAGRGTGEDKTRPGLQGYFTVADVPDPNRLARVILELQRIEEEEKEG